MAQALKAVVNGRPMFASVDIEMEHGTKVLADAGSMTWMDEEIKIETSIKDGLKAGFCRAMAHESCCLNTYTGQGKVGFAFDLPGDIMAFAVNPQFGWVLSQGAFICGTENIKVSGRFAGCCACLTSGEGPFLTKVTSESQGIFYAGGFGSIVRHDIPAGQTFFCDNGLFFAAQDTTKLRMGIVGGVKSFLCSGEGFVMQFYGPCTIFTQSRDPSIFKNPLPGQQASNAAS